MLTDERIRMTYGLPSREEEIAQKDLLEKGKAAPIGEVRTWSGQQYVKHADGWVHVHPTTGKVSVLPTSGPVRKTEGNEEHREHFEKHINSSSLNKKAKEDSDKITKERQVKVDNINFNIRPDVDKKVNDYLLHKKNYDNVVAQQKGTYSHDLEVKKLYSVKEKALKDSVKSIVEYAKKHNVNIHSGINEIDSSVNFHLNKTEKAAKKEPIKDTDENLQKALEGKITAKELAEGRTEEDTMNLFMKFMVLKNKNYEFVDYFSKDGKNPNIERFNYYNSLYLNANKIAGELSKIAEVKKIEEKPKLSPGFKTADVKNPKVGDNFYVWNQRVKIDKITQDGRYEISHVDGKSKLNDYYSRLVVDKKDLQDKYEKITPVDKETQEKLKSFQTDDYQKRGGGYPESGKPTSIDAYRNMLTFNFKNTEESTGKNFAKRFIESKNLNKLSNHYAISSEQEGDYEDDWVSVTVAFLNKSNKEE